MYIHYLDIHGRIPTFPCSVTALAHRPSKLFAVRRWKYHWWPPPAAVDPFNIVQSIPTALHTLLLPYLPYTRTPTGGSTNLNVHSTLSTLLTLPTRIKVETLLYQISALVGVNFRLYLMAVYTSTGENTHPFVTARPCKCGGPMENQ